MCISLFVCSTIRTKRARPKSSATLKTPVAAPPGGEGGPEDRDHMYRGVRQRRWGRWVSEVREPNRGKRHWLGTVGATLAYDRADVAIFGSGAIVNFPSAFFISTAQPVQCHPASSSPYAAAASVFVEHKLRPMLAAASVLTEHGVKPMMASASILDEHEVKPVITASVFGECEVEPMVTASVFGEHKVKLMVATSVFDEREVKPMVAASVFGDREVKLMVAASVFGEREVKPMVAASVFGELKTMPVHGVGDDAWISRHGDASWAEREEVYADYLKDIAMYIDVDAITEKLVYHPDIYGKDYQVDGFDAEFTVSPLWELGD
ncbi:uncharacterized protein LOC119354206 [Triticum dicoccoides]|uniref:uncharacterized protein LOC119354206 n=1 Tax=Triticum dicoccoides TaxID=85692 RepID=UPI00188E7A0E|nr:uncharacterized protein LOC119354206 [Triticum dicoccoides]